MFSGARPFSLPPVGAKARRLKLGLIIVAWLATGALHMSAQQGYDRYALVLRDPPIASQITSRKELSRSSLNSKAVRIRAAQRLLRDELKRRNITVTSSVETLLNAVFVAVPQNRVSALDNLPGVVRTTKLRPIKLLLDRAAPLVNAPAAWTALGGTGNAGLGVKIGLIDTGIDSSHPAFQDPSLSSPGSDYPKCTGADCAYTNNKIIAARSYVCISALFSADCSVQPDPTLTRPDDFSPRDRVGHGTANAMIAAGETVTAPNGITITGIAPKAYLGNYKIFGSPGVNDAVYPDALITALEDAFTDGMDIVSVSVGSPALYGPLDTGNTCSAMSGVPCDPEADAVQNAVSKGMTVVVAAGNDGDTGNLLPTLNTINSPATASDAITVGAATNSHTFYQSVRVSGAGVPQELQQIYALFGDGPKPATPLTAPLVDVRMIDGTGKACSAISGSPLAGSIALVLRGDCFFSTKVNIAEAAGAVGVIFIDDVSSDYPFTPAGLGQTGIPAMLITNRSGQTLQTFLAGHQGLMVTMDPNLLPVEVIPDTVASFSSMGPVIGTYAIKPELVAPGTNVFTATQDYDPNSPMYDPSGFAAFSGTSFATPIVAGAAALVKQSKPNLTPLQIKSVLVNTASNTVTDAGGTARVMSVGTGKLNIGEALNTMVAAVPATLSFGVIASGFLSGNGLQRTVTFYNIGNSQVQLAFSVERRDSDPATQITITPSNVSLSPGLNYTVYVQLKGAQPAPGSYEGAIVVQGTGAASFRVPFWYAVSDGIPYNILPVLGMGSYGVAGDKLASGGLIGFKLIDRFGLPVQGVPVSFQAVSGGGFDAADAQTDIYGIAAAIPYLGPVPGEQTFQATAGGLTLDFYEEAYTPPTINPDGVRNAATDEPATSQKGVAPGSYISIKGTGLSPALMVFRTSYLPLSLAGVSVSFDVPSKGISVPGRIHFVSYGQVNVQVPWELEGQTSVQMKVSIGDVQSAIVTVPLARNSPGFFEYPLGSGFPAALDQNNQVITASNPAARGSVVQLFCNGLGPVTVPQSSGEPAGYLPLAWTTDQVSVTIGGRMLDRVEFSGLSPSAIGLYQVNIKVPTDIEPGNQPLVLSVGGVTAKTVNLPVK